MFDAAKNLLLDCVMRYILVIEFQCHREQP